MCGGHGHAYHFRRDRSHARKPMESRVHSEHQPHQDHGGPVLQWLRHARHLRGQREEVIRKRHAGIA